jgi:hypothetical protein
MVVLHHPVLLAGETAVAEVVTGIRKVYHAANAVCAHCRGAEDKK